MKAAPNQTIVTGILTAFEAAPDGFGGDIAIDVADNASPEPAADFLRPRPGETMRAFYGALDAAIAQPLVGRRVRVELTFNGGPGGGRAVVRSLEAA